MAKKKAAFAPRLAVIGVCILAVAVGAFMFLGGGKAGNAPVPAGAKPSQVSSAVLEEAKAVVQTGAIPCDVSQAYRIRYQLYEVACRQGLGLILQVENARVFPSDCLTLAAQAAAEPDKPADLPACVLPDNADQAPGLAPLLKQAGAACDPVKARGVVAPAAGRTRFFEAACADGAGFLLEVPINEKPMVHACADYFGGENACAFTGKPQILGWLTRTAAAGGRTCTVTDYRYLTYRTTGETYYEVACGGARGFVLQTTPAGGFKEAIECSKAQPYGGGCTL